MCSVNTVVIQISFLEKGIKIKNQHNGIVSKTKEKPLAFFSIGFKYQTETCHMMRRV